MTLPLAIYLVLNEFVEITRVFKKKQAQDRQKKCRK